MCYIVLLVSTLNGFPVDAGTNIGPRTRPTRTPRKPPGPPRSRSGRSRQQRYRHIAGRRRTRVYLAQAGATGTVTVTGPATVQVSVTVAEDTPILGLSVSQTRRHTAQLQVGVSTGEGVS
jgi:hypothetical protein